MPSQRNHIFNPPRNQLSHDTSYSFFPMPMTCGGAEGAVPGHCRLPGYRLCPSPGCGGTQLWVLPRDL